VKLRFDPAALLRLVFLGAGIAIAVFVLQMIEDGEIGMAAVVGILLPIGAGGVALMLFRLPLYAFFGMNAAGAKLTGRVLAGMAEDAPGRDLFLYQHSYFLYGMGHFREALEVLEEIDFGNIPQELQYVVMLNKGLIQNARFCPEEAISTLEQISFEDRAQGDLYANWLAYMAEAWAQLGRELDQALDMAERAFSVTPSPRIAVILGHILVRMKQYQAAEAWITWGIKRLRRKERYFGSYARYLRALLVRATGKGEEGEKAVLKALAQAPSEECRDIFRKGWKLRGPARKRRQP